MCMNEKITPLCIKSIAHINQNHLSITLKRFLVNYCVAYIDVSDGNCDLVNPLNGITHNIMTIERFSEGLNDPISFKKEFYCLIELMKTSNITYLKLVG